MSIIQDDNIAGIQKFKMLNFQNFKIGNVAGFDNLKIYLKKSISQYLNNQIIERLRKNKELNQAGLFPTFEWDTFTIANFEIKIIQNSTISKLHEFDNLKSNISGFGI